MMLCVVLSFRFPQFFLFSSMFRSSQWCKCHAKPNKNGELIIHNVNSNHSTWFVVIVFFLICRRLCAPLMSIVSAAVVMAAQTPTKRGVKRIKTAKAVNKKKSHRHRKPRRSFSSYIYKVLKEVHPDNSISNKAMAIVNSFVLDLEERIATEAGRLARFNKRRTITAREIQTAVRLVLPHSEGRSQFARDNGLAPHAVSEGTKAVTKWKMSLAGGNIKGG